MNEVTKVTPEEIEQLHELLGRVSYCHGDFPEELVRTVIQIAVMAIRDQLVYDAAVSLGHACEFQLRNPGQSRIEAITQEDLDNAH